MINALPPIAATQLPADIRAAAPERRDAYVAALGFEQLLVGQLTRGMTETAGDALGGGSPYASLLPQALADGVMSAGGLGLARQLTDAIAPPQSTAATKETTP